MQHYLEEGRWSWSRLFEQALASLLSKILSTAISPHQHQPDIACWILNAHGSISCSSALEDIRGKRTKNPFNSLLWHKHIPFKFSLLLWRTLRGKLPTNDKLTNFCIELSQCVCCFDMLGINCIEHIFYKGNFAAKVWSCFVARSLNTTNPSPAMVDGHAIKCSPQDAPTSHSNIHFLEPMEE